MEEPWRSPARARRFLALGALGACLLACRSAREPDVTARATEDPPPVLEVGEPNEWDSRGMYFCSVCAAIEVQTRHGREIVVREAREEAEGSPLHVFHEWYLRAFADGHEHAWLGFGRRCVWTKDSVVDLWGASPPKTYFAKIPALPVPLARRVHGEMLRAPIEKRWTMLLAFEDLFPESPLSRVLAGAQVRDEELDTFLDHWVEASERLRARMNSAAQ